MSATTSATNAARLSALEREYRQLVRRWYPPAWSSANRDALVGTLIDAAESRGITSVTSVVRSDLARQGLRLRASAAFDSKARGRIASISVGAVVGYVVVLVLTSSPAFNVVQFGTVASIGLRPTRLLSLLPFVAAWILAACLAFVPIRACRAAALVLAILVTIGSSSLWFSLPDSGLFGATWLNWWRGLVWAAPASIANLLFLTAAVLLTSLGRPNIRLATRAGVMTAVVAAASLLARTGRLTSIWPDWFWTPSSGSWQGPISIPAIVAVLGITAFVLARTGRSRWGVVLLAVAAPLLLGWAYQLVFDPQVFIAL